MDLKIKQVFKSSPVIEGAGVKLKRLFGFYEKELFDPFLLLDHFGSDNSDDYLKGFPWHPHRGIETVTYMKSGSVEHSDSLGNKGFIKGGDIQWMSSGRGIIHQEMPQKTDGLLQGFQLWVNMPERFKMSEPKYRDIKARDIRIVQPAESVEVKVISGKFKEEIGPVHDLMVDITYLDIQLDNTTFELDINPDFNTFCFVYKGYATFGDSKGMIDADTVVLFESGDKLKVKSGSRVNFLLLSGSPLGEEIAWRGPIVMNSQKELHQAFDEIEKGTFIK